EMIFTVCPFILPFFITAKYVEQIVRTIRNGFLITSELINHSSGSIKHFHAHGSFRLDSIIA
ncbi:hypothetical protein BACOVA_00005, partial [Bacteroides ovatus ATCC 8483]